MTIGQLKPETVGWIKSLFFAKLDAIEQRAAEAFQG